MQPADLRYLSTFYAVCRCGTLTKAAVVLHKTQPAISYDLRQLESQLGVVLFERTGRRLLLTPQGLVVREFCDSCFARFELVRQKLTSGEVTRTTPLRLATVTGFGRYRLLPPVFAKLPLENRLIVAFRTAEEVFKLIGDGEFDLGVVYYPKLSKQISCERLCVEELVLIIPPGFRNRRIQPKDLAQARFVTYDECDYPFAKWFNTVFGCMPSSLNQGDHFEELEEVLEAVAHGRGISILPLDAAEAFLRSGRVGVWRIKGRRCFNELFFVERVSSSRRAEIVWLKQTLKSTRRKVPAPTFRDDDIGDPAAAGSRPAAGSFA
jgi:LysR family transcriptional regulator, cyn operon transcriptional activator